MALVSVSDISKQASIFRRGVLSWDEGQSLKDAGGDVLCRFVDAEGNVIDHPVNRRAMSINPAEIRKVPKVVSSSGGVGKVDAIRTGIAATNARVPITDEAAAHALPELPPLS